MSKKEKLKKARFALPSLVTLGSVFCSFLSMSLVIRGMAMTEHDAQIHMLFLAALAILGSIVFDLFDGKVARWTKTSTKFGMELDSLADGVSFGVAPAVLLYGFALQYAGVFGIIASFLYVSGALVRLARFNIEAPDEGVQTLFKGLPSPAGAAGVSSIVLAAIDFGFVEFTRFEVNTIACIAIVLGLMMVSNINYKTLKGKKTLADKLVVVLGVLGFGAMCFVMSPARAFFFLYCYFIIWGLLLTVYINLNKRPRRKKHTNDEDDMDVVVSDSDEDADDESDEDEESEDEFEDESEADSDEDSGKKS